MSESFHSGGGTHSSCYTWKRCRKYSKRLAPQHLNSASSPDGNSSLNGLLTLSTFYFLFGGGGGGGRTSCGIGMLTKNNVHTLLLKYDLIVTSDLWNNLVAASLIELILCTLFS